MQRETFQQRMDLLIVMLNEVADGSWRATQAMGAAMGQPAAFVMNAQASDSGQGWIAKAPPDSDCKFALCAVGHACLDDRFEDLILTRTGPVYHDNDAMADPAFGWNAVERYFGLDASTANRLFHPASYEDPTLNAVIMRITFYIYETARPELETDGVPV